MKIWKPILIVVVLFSVAAILGRVSDWATGRKRSLVHVAPSSVPHVNANASLSSVKKNEALVELPFSLLKKWTYVESQRTAIPDFIREYDGKTVEMIGFMMPLAEIKDIKSFVLVPSLFGCCYGEPPAINHVVMVRMANGKTSGFYDDAICVRGKFHCGEEKQDGDLVSLYHIDADQVVAQ